MESERAYFSSTNFTETFDRLKGGLCLPETEESWERIHHSLKGLEELCKERGGEHPEMLSTSVRTVHRNISNALNSERTRLSGAALDLLTEVAAALNTEFESLNPLFLPVLLQLCGRTNRVVVSRARACILSIIETTQLAGILSYLAQFVKDKSPSIRLVVVEGTLLCLKCFNPPDLEKEPRSRDVENIIRATIRDANADIRRIGKDVFESFKVLLPNRVDNFAASLSPTKKKYLQLDTKVKQKPGPAMHHVQRKIPSTDAQASAGTFNADFISQERTKTTVVQRPIRTLRPEPPLRSTSSTNGQKMVPARSVAKAVQHGTTMTSTNKMLATFTRPLALSTSNSSGPRRIPVEPSKSLTTGLTSGDKTVKPSRMKTEPKPLHSRNGSTSSHMYRSTSSRTTETASIIQPQSDEMSTGKGVPHKINRMRDITRPTLSQLARTKPMIAKEPTAKALKKVAIRKGFSTTDNKPIAIKSTKSETQTGVARQVKPEEKQVLLNPAAIPLPPSPTPLPTEIASTGDMVEECEPSGSKIDAVSEGKVYPHETELKKGLAHANHTALVDKTNIQDDAASTPTAVNNAASLDLSCKTPISALLTSIQQGFDMTPCSPLSPPQPYVQGWASSDASFKLGVEDIIFATTDS